MALLSGALLPFVGAIVIFGCCVLPFHGLVRKVMPLCQTAARLVVHPEGREHDQALPPAAPNPQSQNGRDGKALSAILTDVLQRHLSWSVRNASDDRLIAERARPRNIISIGALRVDDDVGLAALLATFRI